MKRFLIFAVAVQSVICIPQLLAAGGADYGRGPETDPVAVAVLGTATNDIAVLKSGTSTWNKAATDGVSATGGVATLRASTSLWDKAATDGVSATGDVATLQGQVSDLESGTGTWNQAASDAASATGDVATLQGQVSDLESGTSTWNQAASDAAGATGDVATLQGQVSDLESGTSLWNQASADGIQATGDVATLQGQVSDLESGTNLWNAALQPGIITVTGATNGVDTAAISASNTLGSAMVMVGWWSVTAGGPASAVNLTSFAATTGTLLSDAASPTFVVTTDATGYAALTATVSAATTNYANWVQRDGAVKSTAVMEFDGP